MENDAPSDRYLIIEAAKILNMSAVELMNHPDLEDLLEDVSDYQKEKQDGEHIFKVNVTALTPIKKRLEDEQKAWERA